MKRSSRASICILLFVCFSCFLPLSFAYAASALDMSISVQWTDDYGSVQWSEPAVPVSDSPEETRFWLVLTPGTPLSGLSLNISDLSGSIAYFVPGQDALLEYVTDAMGSLDQPCVTISGYNAAGELVAVYLLYISYQPLPQQIEVLPADATVHYVDENGYRLLSDQTMTFGEGASAVYAMPIDGYTLTGPDSYTVTVDQTGAHPADVTFTYTRIAVSAAVTVHFIDENGYPLLGDQSYTYGAGQHTVTAPALDGYVLTGSGQQNVNVNEYGAAPEEITFTYMRYIAPASVTVHYVDENGSPLLDDQFYTYDVGQHMVTALDLDGYVPDGPQTVLVHIDENSSYPEEVTFVYRKIAPQSVIVHYLDEDGNSIAEDSIVIVEYGKHQVHPQVELPPYDYALNSANTVTVTVDKNGIDYSEITFTYHRFWNYSYIVLDDGTVEIKQCVGDGTELVLPSILDGYTVTSIGDAAFSLCKMVSVTIPDSITHVGTNPFVLCEQLKKVFVSPEHSTLAVIDDVLFSKPEKRLITYPVAKTSWIYSIPDGIQSIGDRAFEQCKNLIGIIIPDSVTIIKNNPFKNCENLERIKVSPDHPILAVIDDVLFSKPDKRLICYPLGKTGDSYTIPNGILIIGDSAFCNCDKLSGIILPDSVIEIDAFSFYGCINLISISIPKGITIIHDYTFYMCSHLTDVIIPESVIAIGNRAFCFCFSLTSITLLDKVEIIGDHAFYDCPNLTITVSRDGYAAQYCKDNNLNYTYPDILNWLNN